MDKRYEIFPPFQHESMITVSLHIIKRKTNKRPPSTFFNADHKKPAVKKLVLKN